MKYLLSIAFTLFFGILTNAQSNNMGARFKFVQETHDFGILKEGDEATYEFVFINTGNEPIIINGCTASCGCTVPTWPRNPIMPSSKGTIFVKFDTHGKNGTFHKTIYIESNAANAEPGKKYEIYIAGSVTPNVATTSKPGAPMQAPVIPVKH
jgi:hypothetical protein